MAQKFASQGCVVSFPLRVASYDLVVDDTDRLWKIQVKQAAWVGPTMKRQGKGDRERWMVSLDYKSKKGRGARRRPRQATEFDWLVVVCREDRIYVIPVDVLRSSDRGEGTLLRGINIKEEVGDEARADSKAAAARWLPYLNNFNIRGSGAPVTAGPPAAEREACEGCGRASTSLQETADGVSLCGECFAAVPVTGPREVRQRQTTALDAAGTKPTKDQLQALVDGVMTKPSGVVHDLREGESVHAAKGDVVRLVVDPRDAERRRRAAQDRLRTHPEDDSQAGDDDKAGF